MIILMNNHFVNRLFCFINFVQIGLHLFADALKDVVATLVQCEETDVAEKINKYIEDLVACTECKKIVCSLVICQIRITTTHEQMFVHSSNTCSMYNGTSDTSCGHIVEHNNY